MAFISTDEESSYSPGASSEEEQVPVQVVERKGKGAVKPAASSRAVRNRRVPARFKDDFLPSISKEEGGCRKVSVCVCACVHMCVCVCVCVHVCVHMCECVLKYSSSCCLQEKKCQLILLLCRECASKVLPDREKDCSKSRAAIQRRSGAAHTK